MARPRRRGGDRDSVRACRAATARRAARAQVARLRGALDARGREVTELAHMLAAWEAMRVGKDTQARALGRVGCNIPVPRRLSHPGARAPALPCAGPCRACGRALGAGAAPRHACLCLSQAPCCMALLPTCSLLAGARLLRHMREGAARAGPPHKLQDRTCQTPRSLAARQAGPGHEGGSS